MRLSPHLNCCNSFALSWVDKVTARSQCFESVVANVVAWFVAALDITHFAELVKMRLVSQLINGISVVLQKLFKYFNGTIIWTAFVPSSPVEPATFCFNLDETVLPRNLTGALALFKTGSYLWYCHKLPDVFE